MKLVRQTTLFFRKGASDKVYEVELCEVADQQFVVNFRYGRRGSVLREGTKTSQPVSREKADSLFDKLVQEKASKGFEVGESIDKTPDPSTASTLTDTLVDAELASSPLSELEQRVLERLREGRQSQSSWKLTRAIWRAGELGIVQAEPLLHGLVSSDAMTNYCIAWSMGRLGQSNSVPVLKRIAADSSALHVSHIATEALRMTVDDAERESLLEKSRAALPDPLRSLLERGASDAFEDFVKRGLAQELLPELLNILYLIDDEICRSTLISVLEDVEFAPPFFRIVRRLFKASELRRDAQVFGILAKRFERIPQGFSKPNYFWRGYKNPAVGEDAQAAFSNLTKKYFRKRVWRTLHRMGLAGSSDFVPMAVGTLLAFNDEDAMPVRSYMRYDWRLQSSDRVTFDSFGGYWAFCNLLFQNSPRFMPHGKQSLYCVRQESELGALHPGSREEAFPDLWRAQPRGLLHLLSDSQCQHVHEFACRALRDCQEFCEELPIDVIKVLLNASYEITLELGVDLATQRYDSSAPDLELLGLLANCEIQRGRDQARAWIEPQRAQIFSDVDFTVTILTSPYPDTRRLGSESAYAFPTDEQYVRLLVGKLVLFMKDAQEIDGAIVTDLGSVLLRPGFDHVVSTLGQDVICELLECPIHEVQFFAGSVVTGHATLSKSPTEKVLRSMLDASHGPVRAMAIKLIANLPLNVLADDVSMLASLSCHPLADVRNEVRPLVQRVASYERDFARSLVDELIFRLLTPGAPDGVPSHTSKVLREDFSRYMDHVSAETVWQLLESRSPPAQELGGQLLSTNIRASDLETIEIVKLSRHAIYSVRSAAWKMFEGEWFRLRRELPTAVRILDSPWEDSRQFGFRFIKESVDQAEFRPEVLISICDSVREDVQQFGQEMITRQFQSENGPEYMLKLSEHPSAGLQGFVTHFLDDYAAGHPERIAQLTPYFVNILSRVNQSRVAKDRIFDFLKSEAIKSVEIAPAISGILARISATCALGDRALTIEAMLSIHEACPEIELPIEVQEYEVR